MSEEAIRSFLLGVCEFLWSTTYREAEHRSSFLVIQHSTSLPHQSHSHLVQVKSQLMLPQSCSFVPSPSSIHLLPDFSSCSGLVNWYYVPTHQCRPHHQDSLIVLQKTSYVDLPRLETFLARSRGLEYCRKRIDCQTAWVEAVRHLFVGMEVGRLVIDVLAIGLGRCSTMIVGGEQLAHWAGTRVV